MSWQAAAWLLLGGSTVLLFLGLPVAFSFLAINIIGAVLYLGGEQGLVQLARNSVVSVSSFSLTPIPMFVLMGEVLFHTGLAVKVLDAVERMNQHRVGAVVVMESTDVPAMLMAAGVKVQVIPVPAGGWQARTTCPPKPL